MRKNILNIRILLLFILVLSIGCKSKYEKLLRGDDNLAKYEEGKKYYEKGKLEKAIQLLENVRMFYTGDTKSSDINYTLAASYFQEEDYLIASYFYEYYYKNFEDSLAKKSMYLDAYCNYLMSPKYTLEQVNTISAINKFQKYINKYPNTENYEDVNKYVRELRIKLENKAFGISMLYLEHKDYRACNVSFNSFLSDYPDSKKVEEVHYYKVKSSYLYAKNSIDEKKEERKKAFDKNLKTMLKLYPETKYKEELSKLNRDKI